MSEHFNVIDCTAGPGWRLADGAEAVRFAAARHAATGTIVEVVRHVDVGSEQILVLPPSAPLARR